MNHRDYCGYKSYKCSSKWEFTVIMHASTTNESRRERTQQYQRKPNKKTAPPPSHLIQYIFTFQTNHMKLSNIHIAKICQDSKNQGEKKSFAYFTFNLIKLNHAFACETDRLNTFTRTHTTEHNSISTV